MPDTTGYVQLSKYAAKGTDGLPRYRLAVLGDCATQHLVTAVKGSAVLRGLALDVLETDYDQVFVQIIDAGSEVYAFQPQAVLIVQTVERLYHRFCGTPLNQRASFAETVCADIEQNWAMLRKNSRAAVLQAIFACFDDGIFGSYAAKVEVSFRYQLQKLNFLLMQGVSRTDGVYLVDFDAIQLDRGRRKFFDAETYFIAKMPIALDALPAVAGRVVDVIQALNGQRVIKCVVLDLDNTLWGGVIGDDGLHGIEIGDLGAGPAFTEFQMWLKELQKRGIILAVCSKNNEDIAKEPFEKHPEMVLRLDDIAMFVANWEDKATNIKYIQQTLNIGMDSMVFIDDNPFERNLVKSIIPDIIVPELPQDPALYLRHLQSLNLFETAGYSEADGERTRQYKTEVDMLALQRQFESLDAYLENLEMVSHVSAFDAAHFPRIAQLTQRSNQFNLRTVRYTETEISALAEDDHYLTLYFELRDNYTDHGLVSVVIMDKQPDDKLFVDTWLMSCRVLKRGMEEFIVNEMVATAAQYGFKTVVGEYLPTKKNAMVRDIYERLGFTAGENGLFAAQVSEFKPNTTFIKKQVDKN